MRAVNLLPIEQRRSVRIEASGRLMGLVGFLAIALVAGALYLRAHNDVNSRQAQLAQTSVNVAKWTQTANSYAPVTTEAQQHTQQLADVTQLAKERFKWARLLAQLARLMPAHTQLQSVQAMTPAAATAAASASASSSSTVTPASAIQLSACATSQDVVARTMVQLRKITGISSVTLSSSSSSGSSGSSTASSGGSCKLRFQFQVSLGFGSSASDTGTQTSTAATDGSTSSAK